MSMFSDNSRIPEVEDFIEELIGLLTSADAESYRFRDSQSFGTTAYDALEVQTSDGQYFNITIDRRIDFQHPRDLVLVRKEDDFYKIKSEVLNKGD